MQSCTHAQGLRLDRVPRVSKLGLSQLLLIVALVPRQRARPPAPLFAVVPSPIVWLLPWHCMHVRAQGGGAVVGRETHDYVE